MSKFTVTVRVEIEQADGEYSSFESRTVASEMDNPGYFQHYAREAAQKTTAKVLSSLAGTHQPLEHLHL